MPRAWHAAWQKPDINKYQSDQFPHSILHLWLYLKSFSPESPQAWILIIIQFQA